MRRGALGLAGAFGLIAGGVLAFGPAATGAAAGFRAGDDGTRSFVAAASALAGLAPAPRAGDGPARLYERAEAAWEAGDYVPALEGLLEVLRMPGGERYLERIALLTGELFVTEEVAPDGRAVRFAPDGRHAAFEIGAGSDRRTRVVALGDPVRTVAELPGFGLAFSSGSGGEAAIAGEAGAGAEAAAGADLTVAYLVAPEDGGRFGRVVVQDLRSDRRLPVADDGFRSVELAFSADGRTLYAVAAGPGDEDRTRLYALPLDGSSPRRLTDGYGFVMRFTVAPTGRTVVYAEESMSPLLPLRGRRPLDADELERVGILDLATGETTTFAGISPALSADGSSVAYLGRTPAFNAVRLVRIPGAEIRVEAGEADSRPAGPFDLARVRSAIAPPAISPDGSRVAFPAQVGESWEIFAVETAGAATAGGRTAVGEPRRLTNNVQHDLFPRFLSNDRLLALMGEARHRRSHMIDVATGERTRLFHNNQVRTIAPEYEWAASPDGTKLLIVADRDGNTISPERGVYLMRLDRRVSRDDLIRRVESELAAERALRAKGEARYAPMADEVRRIVERVSPERLWEYQERLYAFGSKHMTRPGNRPAAEYLHATYASFGYEPEYQWFEPAPGIRTANVVAVLPGTENPELIYVISSHYDSVVDSPGADDNSSGTVVLLETARVLAEHPLPATLVFASLTAEESGLLGAREFVRLARERGDRVVGVLNNDMLGWTRSERLDNTVRYSNDGIRDVQHAAAFLFSDLITYDARYYRGTDAAVFYQEYGDIVGGIGSYPVLGNPNYHRPTDRLETINQRLVEATTRANVAAIMRLASSPSRITGLALAGRDGDAVDVRWDPSPERSVRRYEVVWGPSSDPERHTTTVETATARLTQAGPGTVVAVRAVNERRLTGWDWARLTLER